MEGQPQIQPAEPPRGFFSGHVDDKGRLKLPVDMQQYLASHGDERYFVTSTDGRIARIYPISVWKENEKVLGELNKVDSAAAEAIMFMANDLGSDAKIDAQGRLTLSTDLRRALNLEDQDVRLDCTQGGINIYSQAEYEARKRQAMESLPERLRVAKSNGFK